MKIEIAIPGGFNQLHGITPEQREDMRRSLFKEIDDTIVTIYSRYTHQMASKENMTRMLGDINKSILGKNREYRLEFNKSLYKKRITAGTILNSIDICKGRHKYPLSQYLLINSLVNNGDAFIKIK